MWKYHIIIGENGTKGEQGAKGEIGPSGTVGLKGRGSYIVFTKKHYITIIIQNDRVSICYVNTSNVMYLVMEI